MAALGAIQVYLLAEDIGRFADRPHHVVGFNGLVTTDVLYFVIGLVQRRTDEVCEACVDNAEFLCSSFLYI